CARFCSGAYCYAIGAFDFW
nr:immunoglobulin heavy chain junction region [Macaca mulatta]